MNETKQIQRKEQIMDAALRTIVQKGYDNSRMDDIVKISNLSKGAIYWYYKSKKDVYLDLINYWVLRYSAVINHLIEEDHSAADQLKSLFLYFTKQFENDPSLYKALIEFWTLAGRDKDFQKKLNKVFKNLNVQITALSIMVNIEGILWFTLFDAHGISAREYINTITDFILSGLTNKSSSKGILDESSNK